MDFTFVITLTDGGSGGPATPNDASVFADSIGATETPVFADGSSSFANATPFTENTRPELCALTPEMTILACTSGHGAYTSLFEEIKSHAGI